MSEEYNEGFTIGPYGGFLIFDSPGLCYDSNKPEIVCSWEEMQKHYVVCASCGFWNCRENQPKLHREDP